MHGVSVAPNDYHSVVNSRKIPLNQINEHDRAKTINIHISEREETFRKIKTHSPPINTLESISPNVGKRKWSLLRNTVEAVYRFRSPMTYKINNEVRKFQN